MCEKIPLLRRGDQLPERGDVAEEHNRNEYGRQPDEWKICDSDIRLINADHLKRRRKGEDGDGDNIDEKSKGEHVPDDKQRAVCLAIPEREEINDRSGDPRKDVEVTPLERH